MSLKNMLDSSQVFSLPTIVELEPKRLLVLMLLLVLGVTTGYAQIRYDFQSRRDGDWNKSGAGGSWNWNLGLGFTFATRVPTYKEKSITLVDNHHIKIEESSKETPKVDQFSITKNATLTIFPSRHLIINHGDGVDFTNHGILNINGTLSSDGNAPTILNKGTGKINVNGNYVFTGTLTNEGEVHLLNYSQLSGTIINKGTIISSRADIMKPGGTLTHEAGSTIIFNSIVDIPESNSNFKNLKLTAPGIYYLTGDVKGLEYLNLGENTYLHKNGFQLDADINNKCNLPTHIIDGPTITVASEESQTMTAYVSQSAKKHPIYKFTISRDANPGEVKLTGLSFTTTGSADVDDIEKFHLYSASHDNFSIAMPINPVNEDGILGGGAGTHSFNFSNQDVSLSKSSMQHFWITADLSSEAGIGNDIGVSAITEGNIHFAYSNGNGSKHVFTHDGVLQEISGITTELTSDNQISEQGISKGSAKNPVYRFELQSTGNNKLTGLTFYTDDTAPDSDKYITNNDLSKFQLYGSIVDNLTLATKIGSDIESISDDHKHTFSFSDVSYEFPGGQKHYFWITVDLTEGAAHDNHFTIKALTTGDITLKGAKSGTADAGKKQKIVAPGTTLADMDPPISAGTISRGSQKNPIYSFTFTSAGSNTLEEVNFSTTETNLSSNVLKYQLYTSTTNYFGAAIKIGDDIEVSPTGGVAGLYNTFDLDYPISDGVPNFFWITADISQDATVDETITVEEFTSNNGIIHNIKMAVGDVVGSTSPGATQIIGYPLLMVRSHDPAIPAGTINLDQMRNPIYRFTITQDDSDETVYLESITFTTEGDYESKNFYKFRMGSSEIDNCVSAVAVGEVNPAAGIGEREQTITLKTPLEFGRNKTRYFWISAVTKFTPLDSLDPVPNPDGEEGTGMGLKVKALALEAGGIGIQDNKGRVEASTHDGEYQTIGEATVGLHDNTSNIEASRLAPGQNKRALHSFYLESLGNITLDKVSFNTGGTYIESDITRFQLWAGIENDLHSAGQIGDDIAYNLGVGKHTFHDLAVPFIPQQNHYFWITVDTGNTPVSSNTIYVEAITESDIEPSSGKETVNGITLQGSEQMFCHLCDWSFAKGQTITTSDVGSGYQVKVVVHRIDTNEGGENVYVGENCRKDFGDIRFFEDDLPLSYWMESNTYGEKATFWVKLNGDLSKESIDLVMRYGHEGATTTSDGTATFDFFDDFNQNGENSLDKWNMHKTLDDSTIFIPRGTNHVRLGDCGTGDLTYGHVVLGSNKTYDSFTNGAIEFRYNACVDAIAEVGFRGVFGNPGLGYKGRSDARTNGVNGGQSFLSPPYYDWDHLSDSEDPNSDPPTPGKWYHGKITANGKNLEFYRDGILKAESEQAVFHGPGEISLQNHLGDKVDFDWIFVRKLADTEPQRLGWRGVPVALKATATNYNGFTARWSACPDAASFKLTLFDAINNTPIKTFATENNAYRVEVIELETNRNYKYSVQALCDLGTPSPYSNTVTVSTTGKHSGYGESTSISGNPAIVHVPAAEGSEADNNHVMITPENTTTNDDYTVEVIYLGEKGYEIWPNGRLLVRVSSSNILALNGSYKINHAGMQTPAAAAWRFGEGEWHQLNDATFTETHTIVEISGIDTNRGEPILEILMDDGSGTLPVELSSFTAKINPYGKITIEWVTETETNVMGYRIYRNNIRELDSATLLDALIEARNTSHTQVYTYSDNEVLEPGTYHYWLESVDFDGTMQYYGPVRVEINGDSDTNNQVPIIAGINHTYPNPFNPDIHIAFGVPEATKVKMMIYNIRGQLVSEILNEDYNKGNHTFTWTGTDDRGRQLSSGLYFLRMEMDKKTWIKKIIMSK